jgi:hypothetical protein
VGPEDRRAVERLASYQTCHRRFQQWVQDGTIERALQALAEDLRERGGIDIREAFMVVSPEVV